MKSKIRRVKAGDISFADFATDDTVYIIGIDSFFKDIEYKKDNCGHQYELGRVLRKNVRNAIVAYLQDNDVNPHTFSEWKNQPSETLYQTFCDIEGVGHTTAILLVVAVANKLPPLEDIVAAAIHDSLFVSPADSEMDRIRSKFYGQYDTCLSVDNVYTCARLMYNSYVPSLKLRNPPPENVVIEKVFDESRTWISPDGKYCLDKTIRDSEQTILQMLKEKAEPLREITPEGASVDQLDALKGVCNSFRLSCITGIPGSGKSQVIKWLHDALGNRVLITSYTNKACAVLNQRIKNYRLADCGCIRSVLSTSAMVSLRNKKLISAIAQVQLVIVDESSFLSTKSMYHVLNILKHCQKGCRLLLVGDPDQLPPVQEYGRPFLTLCKFKDSLGAQVFRIETFHRSNAEYIYKAFIGLREAGFHRVGSQRGQVEIIKTQTRDMAVQRLCAAYAKSLETNNSVSAIAETNANCNAINHAMAEMLYGRSLEYRRGGFEAKHVKVNKVGMRAVVTDNFRDKNRNVLLTKNEFVDVASVSADNSVIVRRRINDQHVRLDEEQADTYLQIGWCCTVHKAQGSEEDIIYYLFDANANRAGMAFSCQKELKYVANSRAKNLLRIIAIDSALKNPIECAAAIDIRTIDNSCTRMYLNNNNQ